MWNPVAALLGADREVVTYDMIGHAQAPRPEGPYSLEMFVEQLRDVIASFGGTRHEGRAAVDVVGFSMGALVAQGFAVESPDQVRRLALLHSVFDRTDEERAAIVARVAEVRAGGFPASIDAALERWFTPAFLATNPAVVAEVRRILEANDVDAYANAYEVFATADAALVSRTPGIDCETLVLTGEHDRRSTPEMSKRLAATVMSGEAVVVPALRHLAPVEAPDIVARYLRTFFDR